MYCKRFKSYEVETKNVIGILIFVRGSPKGDRCPWNDTCPSVDWRKPEWNSNVFI